jgi:thiol-disulfide isomerase/thioredoxin
MKKMMLSMLAGMMMLGAMAQNGIFTVRGTFDWQKDSVKFLLVDPVEGYAVMVAQQAITGEMLEQTFDLSVFNKAMMLYVAFNENGNQTHMSVPAIPGETVEFYRESRPLDNYQVTRLKGSQFYVDYNEAEQSIEAPHMHLVNFVYGCAEKFMNGVPEEEVNKEYQEKHPALYKAFMDAMTGYIKAHPDQDASAALIATLDKTISDSLIEDIEATAALLTERARNSYAAGLYKDILAAAKKEAAEKARQEGLEGNMAPDFTLMDINGKPLALSSLRGKWVILDFWGSWCKWCIKGVPQMKEYYAKYNGKLEILGVDCNDTVEKWKAAVAQYELPWVHVYWDKDDETSDNPIELYGVRGFPTKVVIDPEGKVAKTIVGEDPAFYDFLDKVLQ